MNPSRPLTSLALAATLLVAALLSTASAQIDDRARTLLEGLQPATKTEVRNVEQSVTTTTFLDAGHTAESKATTVIDFENRRLSMTTEMPGMTSHVVLVNGVATVTTTGVPGKQQLPPEAAAQLAKEFDQADPIVLGPGDGATDDGVVSYGDIVSGDQVTYTTHDETGNPTTTQYLFQDGKVLAVHMSVAGAGEILVLYDKPVDTQAFMAFDSTTYVRTGDEWKKISRTHVEAIAYNVTLDESLFE